MLNAMAKAYNRMPKPHSKTQKEKAELAKNAVVNRCGCEQCKRTDVTLYKVNGKYWCKEHRPEVENN